MQPVNPAAHPLTQNDCETCVRILQQSVPQRAAELERMKRAGFDLPDQAQRNQANATFARGILQEYFPERVPFGT